MRIQEVWDIPHLTKDRTASINPSQDQLIIALIKEYKDLDSKIRIKFS